METHILFFILAGLLLLVLVGASIWSARREKSRIFSNIFSKDRPPSTPIRNEPVQEVPPTLQTNGFSVQTANTVVAEADVEQIQQETENKVREIKISVQGVTPASEPVNQTIYSSRSEPPVAAEPQVNVYNAQPVVEPQPIVEPVVHVAQPDVVEQEVEPAVEEATGPQPVVLYVVAPEGQYFPGSLLLQAFESLDFHYGEYQIFHRHLDSTSKASPVIFSVANVEQPGSFDLDKMEQFATVGVVFFMHLPSPAGRDLHNLKNMIRTVESFAQSVGGFVLDDQNRIFDDESRRNYLLRVTQEQVQH